MNRQVVAADIGRYEVKLYAGGEMVLFPSQVGEWHKREISSGGKYEVEVNGEKHFVGELALMESSFVRRAVEASKANKDMLVKLLNGLYQVAEDMDTISLATAIPVNQYNAENRKKLRELLVGSYDVIVNGSGSKEILIDQVDITWEGAGVFHDLIMDGGPEETAEYPWLKDMRVNIVDIGSRTCNLLTAVKGNYIDRSSKTDDSHGTLLLENVGGRRISEKDKEEYARSIKDLVEKNWPDADYNSLDTDQFLVFAGGGSKLIEVYLRDYYPKALFPADPATSQVRGLYKMGLVRNASRN